MGARCGKLWSGGGLQAGSVLDRVISQASSEDQTVLYKLADYKKGGLLLETYAKGGMGAAEKLIREEFVAYMYAGGRGRVINRAEYLRWKFRDQEQVVLPIEASLSPYDPLAKWQDHTACWQMSYRGALGESLLHVLIICDTKIHTRLARTLVKCFPKLSLDVVEGEEYLGASSLHLAIAYSNNELVQDLVEAGADVSQRAIGSFFLPRDQQTEPPSRQTNYEGLAYLGEYPLAWAACCANESVYNLLLESEADPDAQDSFGNMILHMVVVCDKLDMFGYALRHPKVPASNGRVNIAGYTPLTLACHLGRASVFREMLELSAKEFWRYSNITCSAYPLNALDTLLPDGKTIETIGPWSKEAKTFIFHKRLRGVTGDPKSAFLLGQKVSIAIQRGNAASAMDWNSALFIILNGTKQEHLNMLDGGIIQRLLEEKWKTFARKKFLKRLLILGLHLLLLSVAVYLRHNSLEADSNPNWGLQVSDLRSGVRLACELGTLGSTMAYIILQQGDELKNQGVIAYFKQLVHEPAKLIFLVSNLLLLACIPARFTQQKTIEEGILTFVLPGTWFLLMFFAGAVRLTGPFVTMIYSMITGDMFTFGIIYTIVLFGFSQSFYFLYKGYPNVQSTLFSSYPSTWMAMFQITMGDYSYSDLANTTYPKLAKAVFALFMVFVPILLLNMLIAMMGNTYAHVIEQSEKEFVKQWAKIVVSLERSVAQEDAHRYLQEYSIGLGPADDPRGERAVMVIKTKAKTRANQRKGALTNWKRVGKVTITELRRRGISGEELRRLMWGRVSISTPTKQPRPVRTLPPDCVIGSETAGLTNGVGSAVTSTLDVMAYTHDLDLSGTGLPLQSAQKQPTPDLLVNGKTSAPNPGQPSNLQHPAAASKTSKVTLEIPKSPGSVRPAPPAMKPAPHLPLPIAIPLSTPLAAAAYEEIFADHLYELVMMSEKPDADVRTLRELAMAAANLEHVPEVDIDYRSTAKPAKVVVAGAMSELFGVASDAPSADAAWKRDRHEHSDSDVMSDSVLLGRASRARRARSASRRAPPPPPHLYVPARSMYLVASESSAVESDVPRDDHAEIADNRVSDVGQEDSHRMRAARPLCIQHATGTAPEEHSLYVVGQGSGVDVESAAPASYDRRRPRPKTAKLKRNRVSPTSGITSPLQPWATAQLSKLSRLIRSSSMSSSSIASHSSQENSPTKRY